MSYSLPVLPYAYDALEPHFDKETMNIHHTKHHQAYVNNANAVLAAFPELNKYNVEELIKNLNQVPDSKRTFMRNNAGGHANHSFFWKNLKPGTVLSGDLKNSIERDFGSIQQFKEQFEKIAVTHFGSGWTWLVLHGEKLMVLSTTNQDSPLMMNPINEQSWVPIIGLDVWEHAYYLRYQNKRIDYIKAFWNVVNWDEASIRFTIKQ